MYNKATFLAAAVFLSLGHLAYAVTPEQVGNYAGKGVFKIYNLSTDEVTTTRSGILLHIEDNDTFTLTDSNGGSSSGSGHFGTHDAVLSDLSDAPSTYYVIPIHFKKTTVKGSLSAGSPIFILEGKFSLKKI